MVIAHRGASLAAPENTLRAYEVAMRCGAVNGECDVRVSADGEVVVIHDPTLARTTDGEGAVAALSWTELRSLDAGSWMGPEFTGERAPHLEELLDLARGNMRMFVELKAGEKLASKTVDVVRRVGSSPEELVFMSFDRTLLRGVRDGMPEVPRVLLKPAPFRHRSYQQRLVDEARELGAAALGLSSRAVGPEICELARAAGLPVLVYTVNGPWQAQTFANWGVDGIITDDPSGIAQALDERWIPARSVA